MKIRKGFISNSSSNSFVICLPSQPENSEDMEKILFDGEAIYFDPSSDFEEECEEGINYWKSSEISQIIFDKIFHQKPNSKKKMIDSLADGWFNGMINFDSCNFAEIGLDDDWWEKEQQNHAINRDLAKKKINHFIKENEFRAIHENKKCWFYVITIADDTKIGSAMEHGDLFRNIPHIRTSYH